MNKVVRYSRWVAKDGSIFTEETIKMRSDFPGNKTTYEVPVAVAFNVGQWLAEHICETHNARVEWERANPVRTYVDGTEVNDTNQGTK